MLLNDEPNTSPQNNFESEPSTVANPAPVPINKRIAQENSSVTKISPNRSAPTRIKDRADNECLRQAVWSFNLAFTMMIVLGCMGVANVTASKNWVDWSAAMAQLGSSAFCRQLFKDSSDRLDQLRGRSTRSAKK